MADIEDGFVDVSHDKDGGLLKKILVEGTGEGMPPPGSAVQVHYVGTLASDGSKFDSSRDRPGNFKFDVGVGQVIKGWDQGICTMKRGEKCILRASSDYAYGDGGSPPKIPPKATLNFEVELFDWKEKVKSASRMTPEERLAHATKMKDEGTQAFKLQDWATAVNRYEDGADYITYNPDQDDHGHSHGGAPCGGHGGDDHDDGMGHGSDAPSNELSDEAKAMAVALLNNCAMTHLKLEDAAMAKSSCIKVLLYDAKNVKAIFRRAQAELALGNHAGCVAEAARVLEIEPENKEAEQLRRKALAEEKAAKQKEKAIYSKMFGPK